ncbi:MFS transporter [Citricoccus sp. I39-566]|uniref:MFS transporter n=1 Tax=Citricoccus sp. I39-566 TaxID=3073268 RepID=UPI00286C6C68|nr:MFS transporter [Citricoccus sp. I39-566]WMY76925.1 MFS transporter [Citricoccus sp. I39-566]
MNFAAYGQLLRDTRIRRVLGVGFIARFPNAATGIILTLHVAVTLDQGYGAAGLAVAAMTLGMAVGSPWRGRLVDRLGLRRALIPSVVSLGIVWTAVPFLDFPWLLIGAFLGGLFSLPVFSVVRQSIGVLTHGPKRETAFALDSIITETIFMIGPALGAVVATSWSSAWGLAIVGWSAVAAGAYLMWFNPPTRSSQLGTFLARPGTEREYSAEEDLQRAVDGAVHGAPAHLDLTASELTTGALPVIRDQGQPARDAGPAASPGPVASPGLLARVRANFGWLTGTALAVLAVSLGSGMLMSGTEVAIVAELEQSGAAGQAGVVIAFWCGASAVGGILYGALGRRVSPLLLLALFALGTLPMALVDGVWALAVVSIISGLFTAPTLAAASALMSHVVTEDRRGEAMGYYGSAMTAGAAMGAPVAGAFIDGISPEAGYLFAGLIALVLVGVAVAARTVRRSAARRRRAVPGVP